MFKWITTICIILLFGLFWIVKGRYFYKNYQGMKGKERIFAIQSVSSNQNLRIHNASKSEGAPLVLFRAAKWQCMTWELIEQAPNKYKLKNIYTQKSLRKNEQSSKVVYEQTTLENSSQTWDFIPSGNEYLIKDHELNTYLTVEDGQLTLAPLTNTNNQKWRLVPQKPYV